MPIRRLVAALLMLALAASGPGSIPAADPPTPEQAGEVTPTRVSYLYGEVSFWRPGAQEWAEAKANTPAVLRVEMRGTAKSSLPSEMRLENFFTLSGGSHWSVLKLDGEQYKNFGEVTAWRVTLWAGDEMIGEQKSFLW